MSILLFTRCNSKQRENTNSAIELNSLLFNDTTVNYKTGKIYLTYHMFSWWVECSKNNDTLKCADILAPTLKHETDSLIKEFVLKGIAKHHNLYKINLYSSVNAFAEQMKNDAPLTAAEYNKKNKIIWDGLTGSLTDGKYYEYELIHSE